MLKRCAYCGKEYKVKPSSASKSSYCSKSCMALDYKTRLAGTSNPHFKGAGWWTCKLCGKRFHSRAQRRVYCSLACRDADPEQLEMARKHGAYNAKIRYCKSCGQRVKGNRVYCDACWSAKQGFEHKCACCGATMPGRDRPRYCHRCWTDRKFRKQRLSTCSTCGVTFVGDRRKYCDACWRAKLSTVRKVDENQPAIVEALRTAGASVLDMSKLGRGCPDIFVGHNGKNYLMEIKNPKTKGRLNKRQIAWHAQWAGKVYVVESVEEALGIIGVIKV